MERQNIISLEDRQTQILIDLYSDSLPDSAEEKLSAVFSEEEIVSETFQDKKNFVRKCAKFIIEILNNTTAPLGEVLIKMDRIKISRLESGTHVDSVGAVEVMKHLFFKRYQEEWTRAAKRHFEFCYSKIIKSHDYFLSYSNRNAWAINDDYHHIISRLVPEDHILRRKKEANIFVDILHDHLNTFRGYYDKK